MEGTPRFYDTLVQVLSPHQNGVDRRQLKTLAWRLIGLRESGQSVSRPGYPLCTAEPWTGSVDRVESPRPSQQPCGL
jgi:hypothetical protein